ncbi:acetyltransferase [Candidatus Dependentiae bacterium]|nr:acetyltransferase [Candidatus Dependentiae bacterium]
MKDKKKIFIVGARWDGHPRVVADTIFNNNDYEIAGFIDDNKNYHGKLNDGIPVLGGFEKLDFFKENNISDFIIATGDGPFRIECAHKLIRLGFKPVNIIDNRSIVSRTSELGVGLSICANAVVAPGAVIKDYVLINHSAVIDHNVVLETGVTISPGVKIGGRAIVKEKTFIGIGSVILPDITIGSGCIIGAGTVVIKNISDNKKAVGNPARFI